MRNPQLRPSSLWNSLACGRTAQGLALAALAASVRSSALVVGRVGLAGGACVASLALAGCEDTVTEENYSKLTPGMSLSQVEKILGGAGERVEQGGMSISAAGLAGGSGANSQVTYSWKSGSREITATFQGDKLVNTGKAGL